MAILDWKDQASKAVFTHFKQSNEELGEQSNGQRKKHQRVFEGKEFMKIMISLARKQIAMAGMLESIIGKSFDVVFPKVKLQPLA